MYLVVIIVPIYVEGPRHYVTTEWKRSLVLLRDSLAGRFGEITVLAPELPLSSKQGSQELETLDREHDGIEPCPSIPARMRAREYWLTHRAVWLAECARLIERADVVHSGLDDLYRPMMYDALKLAFRRGRPTVFVQDTDIVLQIRELNREKSVVERLKWELYCQAYERKARRGVHQADLSLLKGRSLMDRYGAFAKNARDFHDTSYLSHEIAPASSIERRVASLDGGRPLKLVYCGRLIARKGVLESVRMLAEARRRGASVELDVIGDGDQRAQIESAIRELEVGRHVRCLGSLTYGAELIARLATYDALYFTPPVEDTPRMIFDGYAAGLPLIATDIEYVRERAESEQAAVVIPRGDHEAGVAALLALDRDRASLRALTAKACAAGVFHAADNWYRRRAEWTFEAVERCAASASR